MKSEECRNGGSRDRGSIGKHTQSGITIGIRSNSILNNSVVALHWDRSILLTWSRDVIVIDYVAGWNFWRHICVGWISFCWDFLGGLYLFVLRSDVQKWVQLYSGTSRPFLSSLFKPPSRHFLPPFPKRARHWYHHISPHQPISTQLHSFIQSKHIWGPLSERQSDQFRQVLEALLSGFRGE